MKKVLIICGTLSIGGAEKVASDIALCADMTKYAFDYVVFGDEKGEYEPALKARGCRVLHMPAPSDGYGKYVKSLRALIKKNKYDIVHAHTMLNIGWAMLAAKREGVPVRVSHAHTAMRTKHGALAALYETAMRALILRYATCLAACGVEAGENLYGKRAFAKKGVLWLNGVDTASFAFDTRKRVAIRKALDIENRFIIGSAGHLIPIKNHKYLLELMPEILKHRPDALLLILGEGDERPALERRIDELGIQNAVRLTGMVMNVADYLSAMDVFAFPSIREGMPLAILEVQSNGLPCVISKGVPDDVFVTDLIHPLALENPHEWVETLCACARGDCAEYARLMKNSGFDVSTAMAKIYEVYEG